MESDQSWNYRRTEAILANKVQPIKNSVKPARFFYLIWFSGATHPPCPHETPKSDHGYEVMFWKRDLSGTSFIAASEVKCPLRKSTQLLKRSYKFLKNEQFFPCMTTKKKPQKNCILRVWELTTSVFMIFAMIGTLHELPAHMHETIYILKSLGCIYLK